MMDVISLLQMYGIVHKLPRNYGNWKLFKEWSTRNGSLLTVALSLIIFIFSGKPKVMEASAGEYLRTRD